MEKNKAIDEKINLLLNLKDLYAHSNKPNYSRIMHECIKAIERGEIDRKIIDKMKNEKYDVWISLPGSFTNIPKFVRDVEKEVIK